MIFCGRVVDTQRVGKALLDIIGILEENNEEIPEYFHADSEKESYFFAVKWYGADSYISKCLERGIGVHFGDMPEPVRRSVESDYNLGNLRVLVSTSTVGQGLNMPIKHLIVHSTIIGYAGTPQKVRVRDFWNIVGRAGRAGKETEGQVVFVIFTQTDYESYQQLTDRSNIEAAYSMLFNVLDALVTQRINQSVYDEFMQILAEPYLLSILAEEAVETEDEEIIEKIINNSLFKVQIEKKGIDLQPIRDSFSGILSNIKDKVPERDLIKVYGKTGFQLSSNQAIDDFVQANKEQIEDILKEDNYLELVELVLKLFDLHEIEEVKSNKLEQIGLPLVECTNVIKSWIEGTDIEQLQAEWQGIGGNTDHLNILISDGLYYRYTWAFTAFINILCHNFNISWEDLPENIRNLPSYVKFGLNNPIACLARSLGIKNRDISLLLSSESNNLSGRDFIKWVANLSSEDLDGYPINRYDKQNILETALRLNPNRYAETPSSFNFNVRGIPYSEERIQTSLSVKVGDTLSYQRDIENPYDPFAIRVFHEGRELGFVPREYSKLVSTEIDINNTRYEIIIRRAESIRNYQNVEVNMYTQK